MLLTKPKEWRKHNVAPQVFVRSILWWIYFTERTLFALDAQAPRDEGGTSVGTEGVFDAVFWSAVTQKHRLCRERWPVLLATFFTRTRRGAEKHHHPLLLPLLPGTGLLLCLAIVLIFFLCVCMYACVIWFLRKVELVIRFLPGVQE